MRKRLIGLNKTAALRAESPHFGGSFFGHLPNFVLSAYIDVDGSAEVFAGSEGIVMQNDQTKTVTIRILKHREANLLRAVPDDATLKRQAPWDPKNPDLRGFCLHGTSEGDIVARLGPALRDFLEHLGFVVQGDVMLTRDAACEVENFWPSVYTATAQLSHPERKSSERSRVSGRHPATV
jgi:hypothetical protein